MLSDYFSLLDLTLSSYGNQRLLVGQIGRTGSFHAYVLFEEGATFRLKGHREAAIALFSKIIEITDGIECACNMPPSFE